MAILSGEVAAAAEARVAAARMVAEAAENKEKKLDDSSQTMLRIIASQKYSKEVTIDCDKENIGIEFDDRYNIITKIYKGSCASKNKELRKGDRIVAVNGQDLNNNPLKKILQKTKTENGGYTFKIMSNMPPPTNLKGGAAQTDVEKEKVKNVIYRKVMEAVARYIFKYNKVLNGTVEEKQKNYINAASLMKLGGGDVKIVKIDWVNTLLEEKSLPMEKEALKAAFQKVIYIKDKHKRLIEYNKIVKEELKDLESIMEKLNYKIPDTHKVDKTPFEETKDSIKPMVRIEKIKKIIKTQNNAKEPATNAVKNLAQHLAKLNMKSRSSYNELNNLIETTNKQSYNSEYKKENG